MTLRTSLLNSNSGDLPLPSRNRVSTLLLLFIVLMGITCTDCTGRDQKSEQVEQAGSSYRTQKDYTSLELISKHLHRGMPRSEVEELLGKADYSPIEGQEYYSSDRREAVGSGKERMSFTVGLVVEYRDERGELTGQLQRFWLGRIGE